jgi:hypothetical protein
MLLKHMLLRMLAGLTYGGGPHTISSVSSSSIAGELPPDASPISSQLFK